MLESRLPIRPVKCALKSRIINIPKNPCYIENIHIVHWRNLISTEKDDSNNISMIHIISIFTLNTIDFQLH